MGFIITELFAFVDKIDDEDGDEGVIGMSTDFGWIPLIGADMARVESLRPIAEKVAKETGKKVILKKFKLTSEEEITKIVH